MIGEDCDIGKDAHAQACRDRSLNAGKVRMPPLGPTDHHPVALRRCRFPQSRLNTTEANQPVATAIIAVARP